MPVYRFYYVDSDGHISEPPRIADFRGDRGAIKAAEALLNGKAIEVWDGGRIVIRLEPKR